jgi:Major Facilitator Superfamily
VRRSLDLLRREPIARVFFVAWTQSALGTGAAYVALLLVAYERFHSPWAISVVLIADLVAPMLLGPVLGAAADRWSRKWSAVASDLVRALAFVGIALVSSFEATVALAFVAGAGTALFTPATLAALPSLVQRERLPAATSLYGAISDLGLAIGPALAAAFLLVGGIETILIANGVTFAVSALILARLDYGRAPERTPAEVARPSLLRDTREGLRAIPSIRGLRTVLFASAAALFFAGLVNVAEVPFVLDDLEASDAVYSAAVALAGAGIAGGSLMGASGGALARLRARYLVGLAVMALGTLLLGLVPRVEVMFATFAIAGVGNGLMLVYERLIIQATVADELAARVFGIKDALTAWAFGVSFLIAGALVSGAGARITIVGSGVGILVVAAVAVFGVRAIGTGLPGGSGAELRADGGSSQDRAHFVGSRSHWLALLDDLRHGGDDDGIELGSGVRR